MAGQGNVHGIVIGIDDYETFGVLRGCENDAMAFACRLERLQGVGHLEFLYQNTGYNRSKTPTRSHILAALHRVVGRVEEDDYLMFYFAGHGIHDATDGHCLLPIDGLKDEPVGTGLLVDDIVHRLQSSRCRNVILFIDACRNFTDRRGDQEEAPGFSHAALQLPGVLTFSACMLDQVSMEFAFDKQSSKGLFTHALLEAWESQQSGLSFLRLYDATKNQMEKLITEHGIHSEQRCSLAADPMEKTAILVPRWVDSPEPTGTVTVVFPQDNTIAATVTEVRGHFSGEFSAWRDRKAWVNLLDANGNRFLQQPALEFKEDGTWSQNNISVGDQIIALEILSVTDFGHKKFEQMVEEHSFGAFRDVPEGTVGLARIRLA